MKFSPTVFTAVFLLSAAGCPNSAGRPAAPRPRMIPFSPALTRIVFDLGLGDHVVGVSEYASPPDGRRLPVVGNAQAVRTEPILALEPDVILTQSDPRNYETLRRLRPGLKIEHFRIETLEDIADATARIGQIVGRDDLGKAKAEAFRRRLAHVRETTKSLPTRRVLFVMDYQNPFAAGGGIFLDEMIRLAGGVNVLADVRGWHTPSVESILSAKPEVIVCQCKPSQADEAKRYWSKLFAQSGLAVRVCIVTDDAWTIPAGHLAGYTEELAKRIHPEEE
ncbi:MAG: ABC transporter substrate-binding protein [Phycisphaerae bacterium]|nr:ABC transporter substrate-binding protein [Phycisphaerae bacterium]